MLVNDELKIGFYEDRVRTLQNNIKILKLKIKFYDAEIKRLNDKIKNLEGFKGFSEVV